MRPRKLAGVPMAMQQDGWWLDAPVDPVQKRKAQRRRDGGKVLLLLALIALGDALVWHAAPGLNLVVFAAAVLLAVLSVSWPRLTAHKRVAVVGAGTLSLLPLVELVQPLSVLIAVVGLSVCIVALAGVPWARLVAGAARLWWVAPA